jgi:hypothetical protein
MGSAAWLAGNAMEHLMTKLRFVALALAGALLLTTINVTSASAYWRGRGWGIAGGIAAGALIGSAIAARPYYYGPAYPAYGAYYGAPRYYYGPPVVYAPVAAVPYGYGYGYGYYGYHNGYGSGCGGSYGQRRGCSWGDTAR